jgi:hypothetical protein
MPYLGVIWSQKKGATLSAQGRNFCNTSDQNNQTLSGSVAIYERTK